MLPSDAKILVVEDEALFALDLEYLLRELGAGEIIVAYSLKDAAFELKRHPCLHLALVDVYLRDGLGLQLIETLKEREVPVILTTGYEVKLPDVPVILKPGSLPCRRSMTLSNCLVCALHGQDAMSMALTTAPIRTARPQEHPNKVPGRDDSQQKTPTIPTIRERSSIKLAHLLSVIP